MSIRDELKSQLQANIKKWGVNDEQLAKEANEQFLKLEALDMIQEFIIPKFRRIAEKNPLSCYLRIIFHRNTEGWYYTSDIDDKKESPYKGDVILKAMQLSNELDIKAYENPIGSGETTISFILDLR